MQIYLYSSFFLSLFLSPSLFLKLKQEHTDDRKFQRSLKERQGSDMKKFTQQQKADYRAAKALYKKVGTTTYNTVVPF